MYLARLSQWDLCLSQPPAVSYSMRQQRLGLAGRNCTALCCDNICFGVKSCAVACVCKLGVRANAVLAKTHAASDGRRAVFLSDKSKYAWQSRSLDEASTVSALRQQHCEQLRDA